MPVEQRFGGAAPVRLNTVEDMLVSKMHADARDLIAILSRAETMGEFEEQNRLLAEFQGAHRALHVIKGTVTVKGETILVAPPTAKSLASDVSGNVGGVSVAQALENLNSPASADHTDDDDDPEGKNLTGG
jgi:hypothetical protein